MSAQSPVSPDGGVPAAVLVVEDNAVIAMNTEMLLEDMGVVTVRTAGTVAEALALVDAMQFDLAILDFKLDNDENSLPVAERLDAAKVPFVFASGMGENIDLPDAFRDAPILKKPYSYDDLEQVVRTA